MKDLVSKLVANLRDRLKEDKVGKPTQREIASWGAKKQHWGVPLLLSFAITAAPTAIAALVVSLAGLGATPSFAVGFMLTMAGFFFFPLIVGLMYFLRHRRNQLNIIKAYEKLLKENERFTLVEYAKYLKRLRKRAKAEGASKAEIKRLSESEAKLVQLLKKGAGLYSIRGDSTPLEAEADVAESLAEAYEVVTGAETDFLDNQLSDEMRQRVLELEDELASELSSLDLESETEKPSGAVKKDSER